MTNLSLETLMLSIKALQRDIDRHEQLSASGEASDEDIEYYGQYVMDLMKALSELSTVYQEARTKYPGSPSLDDLMLAD